MFVKSILMMNYKLTDSLWQRENNNHQTQSNSYLIGILQGEGIGSEIIKVVVNILKTIEQNSHYNFNFNYGGLIGKDAKAKHGQALTPEVIEWCQNIFNQGGTILCGAGGSRFVYDLRRQFDLFCKFTPIRPFSALNNTGVLRPSAVENVDIIIVRENISGVYFGEWKQETFPPDLDRITHSFSYNKEEVKRILQVAVNLAKMRRKKLSLIVKIEGVPAISKLWIDVLKELVKTENIETEVLDVDHANYQIIASAQNFDVIVAPNLFGDIISDTAALLLGSRGLSYSGNFGKKGIANYQTGHGAAYDLKGKNIANPIGQILSASMMLRESFGLIELANLIEISIEKTLAQNIRTLDIASNNSQIVGTWEMGEYIAENLAKLLQEH